MSFHSLIALFLLVLNISVWIYHSLFTHSSTEGHLGSFQLVAIMNKVALNICVLVFVWM